MCGILGLWRFDGRAATAEELTPLLDRIVHRGPDDAGAFARGSFAMGMRRLSIIDLGGGRQPMQTACGRYVIVFNGEVYNYKDLKADLVAAGRVFKTSSDTEVVLEGYALWGERVLERMNGLWGLAIYDTVEEELFLARDRLGKKQLYYAATPDFFVFGSEMKTALEFPGVSRKLRLDSLREFLTYGYVGGPQTAVEGIALLPEGSFARVRKGKPVVVRRYWDPSPEGPPVSIDEGAAAEDCYRLLVDSVRQRLVSDVPIAVMLSSGLDSSSIAYALTHELGAPLHAVSVGYDDDAFDESEDAGRLARKLGLLWTQRTIHGKDARAAFPKMIDHMDSLQANTAQFVYHFTCETIHDLGFKVALNGSGGDELFVGYPTYQANTLFRGLRRVPGMLRRLFARAAFLLPTTFGRVSFDYKVRKFAEASMDDPLLAHASWRAMFTREGLEALLTAGAGADEESFATYRRAFRETRAPSFLKTCLVADLKAWLIAMMPWIDNISMAHSVELRLPFLDYRLVERALSLEDGVLWRGWKLKRLMKRFLADRLPADALTRRKRGTHVPLSRWINGDLRELVDHHLEGEALAKTRLFRPERVRRLLADHRAMRRDNTFALWNLVVLAAWLEHWKVEIP